VKQGVFFFSILWFQKFGNFFFIIGAIVFKVTQKNENYLKNSNFFWSPQCENSAKEEIHWREVLLPLSHHGVIMKV
jgi:hypothetical protein